VKIRLAEAQPRTTGFSPFTSSFKSDFGGFSRIALLARQLEGAHMNSVELSLEAVEWFDANLCAPLGAVLYRANRAGNAVAVTDVEPKVSNILTRNGFLSHYGRARIPDVLATTIPYQRLEPEDDRYFGEYVDMHLLTKGIPKMTIGLRKKFLEAIFEIFSNAVQHSQTRMGIYACAQYYPKTDRLDFSVVDLGVGIRENVVKFTRKDLSAAEAIGWAVSEQNTTKRGRVPGGLGLKLLREFITKNEGRIQIVSEYGYWEQAHGQVTTKQMSNTFPGTIVNLELNTADTKSYCLQSELKPGDVF